MSLRSVLWHPYLGLVLCLPVLLAVLAFLSDDLLNFWPRALALVSLTLLGFPRLAESGFSASRDIADLRFWIMGLYHFLWLTAFTVVMPFGTEDFSLANLFAGLFYAAATMALFNEDRQVAARAHYKQAERNPGSELWHLLFLLLFVALWIAIGVDNLNGSDRDIWWPAFVFLPFLFRRFEWSKGSLNRWLERICIVVATVCALLPGVLEL